MCCANPVRSRTCYIYYRNEPIVLRMGSCYCCCLPSDDDNRVFPEKEAFDDDNRWQNRFNPLFPSILALVYITGEFEPKMPWCQGKNKTDNEQCNNGLHDPLKWTEIQKPDLQLPHPPHDVSCLLVWTLFIFHEFSSYFIRVSHGYCC